jgi:hypothetical protein
MSRLYPGVFASKQVGRRSEQPTQQASQAGQDSPEQPEDPGQQTADGTPETPQQAHLRLRLPDAATQLTGLIVDEAAIAGALLNTLSA